MRDPRNIFRRTASFVFCFLFFFPCSVCLCMQHFREITSVSCECIKPVRVSVDDAVWRKKRLRRFSYYFFFHSQWNNKCYLFPLIHYVQYCHTKGNRRKRSTDLYFYSKLKHALLLRNFSLSCMCLTILSSSYHKTINLTSL